MTTDSKSIRKGEGFGAAERRARILVVDDDNSSRLVLMAILRRAGFDNLVAATSVRGATTAFEATQPDLLIVDLHLPDDTGLSIVRHVRKHAENDFLPVLMLTGDMSGQSRDAALSAGATDFVGKPYDATELLLRVHNLLKTRVMHLELRRQRALLEERFTERGNELEDARLEILERLARVAEQRDDGAFGHIRRVGELAGLLADELGCEEGLCEMIRRSAPLHDVGKIGIRDEILLKAGPLAPSEFEQQERHTLIGAHILAGGRFPVIRMAEQIALTHHERWDGRGYPSRLKGEEIPLAGRITAVADTFDALIHPRPDKPAWPIEDAPHLTVLRTA
jgi:putative two-component system response regulator